MRVLFLGTGEIALPTFSALLKSDHEVVGLVTQPDRPVGRSGKPKPPAIKVLAEGHSVDVFQPEKVRAEDVLAQIRGLDAEVMVVMAYGQILPQALIDMPSKAIINLHASLLPKYRGASCIQSAILNGDTETGWSVMHVVKALDAGDVIAVSKTAIRADDTGESLHDRLAEMGPDILLEVLRQFEAGSDTRMPQDESQVIYAPKLSRDDARLDWSQPAEILERQVRALHSWPGTFTRFLDTKGREKRLKVFPPVQVLPADNQLDFGVIVESSGEGIQVACGDQMLSFEQVQPEGARRMTGEEFLRGVDAKSFF